MKNDSKIYVAGHNGLVGSALVRTLEQAGFKNIVTRTRKELDLLDQRAVEDFFQKEKPEYVFLAAALVGGIMGNFTRPADFIYQNLQIEINVLESARRTNVKKLLFLGSSCIYPKLAEQPIKEEYFMTGKLEPTNEPYAVAKIAGIVLCQSYNKQYGTDFVSVMPTNLYGPSDNFSLDDSHVLPAFIRKFNDAKERKEKEIVLWGTGIAKREFLHVDDLALACFFVMQNYSGSEIVNIGTGEDVSIKDLAEIIKGVVGYEGSISWDSSKPDGTPRKLLDVSKIKNLGWSSKINLVDGIKMTYDWYKSNFKI